MSSKILIIDDEEDVRIVLSMTLKRAGYSVLVAADGREALELLDETTCDLVITDVIMPGMDGVAVVEELRRRSPEVPVIVISGGGNPSPSENDAGAIATTAYLASASRVGADRTLTKPFDRDQLLSTVETLLDRSA